MKVVVQRVLESSVLIDNIEKEEIKQGLMVLLGITYNDTEDDIKYLVNKIINLRIFKKDNKMDLSVKDINGDILLIPQFTLYANTKKGNRPSFENAMKPDVANLLFEKFKSELLNTNINSKFGKFGSHMQVSLINDGPVTIIIDSKDR